MKKRVNITDWSFSEDNNPYIAPDQRVMRLYGDVYGHLRIENTHEVSTSAVLKIDYEKCEVETLNTIYVLGKPSEKYAKMYDLSKFNFKRDE
jgi:hypothetical protein